MGLSKYAGPGGWNDLDFVMTGTSTELVPHTNNSHSHK